MTKEKKKQQGKPGGAEAETKATDPQAEAHSAPESGAHEQPAGQERAEESAVERELQQARDEIDRLKRALAELDNQRKRAERQVEEARKYAIEKFAFALLDVVDNLERALAVEEGNEAALREGLKMTLDAWHAVMRKFEMERIDAVGKPFDPHHHEALSHMPSEEHPEGVVAAQHVAGYTLSGRLLRPAKVLVSAGAPAAREADSDAEHAKNDGDGDGKD